MNKVLCIEDNRKYFRIGVIVPQQPLHELRVRYVTISKEDFPNREDAVCYVENIYKFKK